MSTRKRQRSHNEWFRPVSLGNRKSCPNCRKKLPPGESIWSWGEYVSARWHTVQHFCRECWRKDVREFLRRHVKDCGCRVDLVGYGSITLPDWLTLAETHPLRYRVEWGEKPTVIGSHRDLESAIGHGSQVFHRAYLKNCPILIFDLRTNQYVARIDSDGVRLFDVGQSCSIAS